MRAVLIDYSCLIGVSILAAKICTLCSVRRFVAHITYTPHTHTATHITHTPLHTHGILNTILPISFAHTHCGDGGLVGVVQARLMNRRFIYRLIGISSSRLSRR